MSQPVSFAEARHSGRRPQPDVWLGVPRGPDRLRSLAARLEPLADLGDAPTLCSSSVTSTRPWAPPSPRETRDSRRSTSRPASRSFDRSMPEEINRVLTDAISDLLLSSPRRAPEGTSCVEGIRRRGRSTSSERHGRLRCFAFRRAGGARPSSTGSRLTGTARSPCLTLHRPATSTTRGSSCDRSAPCADRFATFRSSFRAPRVHGSRLAADRDAGAAAGLICQPRSGYLRLRGVD